VPTSEVGTPRFVGTLELQTMNTVEQIEQRRLEELQKQAALFGPQTDPAVLIEIQELCHKKTAGKAFRSPSAWLDLDYDFLMNVVAAALVRLGAVEQALKNDDKKRVLRQLIHDFWMVAMSVIVVITLILQLRGR
jgi:hypothetical protein